ncbi:MAG TPA: hypothetical protein VE127_07445 [Solirubrobacteraceae bacterium]|nr:hypothetical protein [Solirubrobacteraceae bacterium]
MAGGRDSRTAGTERGLWIAVAVVAFVVIVYGGYGHHWGWTGINGHTATLWDWLHLLLLPVAAVILPLWLRHRPRLGAPVKLVVAGLIAGFVALVVAGYTVPWAWTGFTGNRLWDWLNLAALPLAVVLIPVFIEVRSRFGRRHAAMGGAVGAAFIVVVIAGYTIPWAWTGFTGNTLWDWLHLALLPVLVPVAIVPVLTPMAKARMGIRDEAAREPPRPEAEPAAGEPVTPDFADPSTT